MRAISHPVVGWLAFAIVIWASHFSPLFEAALEDPGIHALEHALYLGAALLFWWPVVGADPHPFRMGHGMRLGYLLLAMPQNAFLGFVLFAVPTVLYPHYASLQRVWGPTALEDQQLAGGIMWAGGDLIFLVPVPAHDRGLVPLRGGEGSALRRAARPRTGARGPRQPGQLSVRPAAAPGRRRR